MVTITAMVFPPADDSVFQFQVPLVTWPYAVKTGLLVSAAV
jgi:hypothetical protein